MDSARLVNLYAFVSMMRVVSSRRTIEFADKVVRTIIETYAGPNETFNDVREIRGDAALDPLRELRSARRDELRYESWSPDVPPV